MYNLNCNSEAMCSRSNRNEQDSGLHRQATHHKVTQMSIFPAPGVKLSEPVKSGGLESYL